MDMFMIRGGKPLMGEASVSGAKNAALPIMAACLAIDGRCELDGVPDLVDVRTLASLLGTLGVEVRWEDDGSLSLLTIDRSACVAEYELVRRMRASICVLGPLLGRRGRACVSLPGGCNIGHRPIDLHLKGLAALGADIRIERGYVIAEAARLRGANIYLGGAFGSTVTGTCNVMSAAVFAEGTTTIEAAACEPEVVDLGRFLNRCGAQISGLGTPFLRIEGVEQLSGCRHTIIPDRIEAATLMMAAAITGGAVTLHNVCVEHLTSVVETLRGIGVSIEPIRRTVEMSGDTEVRVSAQKLHPGDVIALPYPGVPTDVQAQLTAVLATVRGMSIVTDKVFPDRFMHVSELLRMGAGIRREGNNAIINGTGQLTGASVMASDLRASAALVLAGLAARGESLIRRIYHLDRGYEGLERKLARLGAEVRRVVDEPQNVPASLQPMEESVRPPLAGPHTIRGPHATADRIRGPHATADRIHGPHAVADRFRGPAQADQVAAGRAPQSGAARPEGGLPDEPAGGPDDTTAATADRG
jgi:UDP-N-acetylglucosamine 1-carboxyvinyltransferase